MGRDNTHAYRVKYYQEMVDLGIRDNKGIYNWPIPVGETYQIRSRNFPGEQPAVNVPKAKAFIDWAVRELKTSPKEFFSGCRRQDLIKIRALINYAARTRFKLSTSVCEKLFNRDASVITHLQRVAVKLYGPEMREVSDLLRRWDAKQ